MKVKVLHIISSKTWRGGEQQVHYLLNAESTDFEYFLFCPEGALIIDRNKEKASKIFSYKKRFGFDVFAALKLKKVCKKYKIDIIHLHDSHAINTFLLADFLGLNIPCIIHRHVNFSINNKWKYQHKKIAKIICVSNTIKQNFSSFIDVKKLTVIHPAIDVKKFSQQKSNILKQELNLTTETKITGIVCALEKEKNIAEFIEIANKLTEKNKDYHFVIIGAGSLYKEFNIQHSTFNIHFLGFRNNVYELLSGFDVFLFTSKNEGFPLVLLEAMANKVPIVTNNFPSVKELIEHQKTGHIYDSVDIAIELIEKVLTTHDLQLTIIENAFQYVQQFDISLMNKKVEAIYSSLNIHH